MDEPNRRSEDQAPDAAAAVVEDDWRKALVGDKSVGVGDGEPYLLIRVGPVWLGLEVGCVDEVGAAAEATALPLVPAHIPGIVSLHGQVLPLLDLQRFLEIEAQPLPEDESHAAPGGFDRVVVVSAGAFRVGLLCHQVRGIIRIPEGAVAQPQAIVGGRVRSYTSGEIQLHDAVVAVLDLVRLLEAAKVAG